MPDHVHLLLWPAIIEYDISKIQQALNGTMSRRYSRLLSRINRNLNEKFLVNKDGHSGFRFWQKGGGFDRNLYDVKMIYNCVRYIENNPVRAGLVNEPDKYYWSSAWNEETYEKWRPAINRSSMPF